MQRSVYTQFENYAESIKDVDLDARMLKLYERQWMMHRFQSGSTIVQHAVEGSGFMTEGAISPAGWGLLIQPAGEPMLVNGVELVPGAVAVLPPRAEFRFVGRGPIVWTSIFVPGNCYLDTIHESINRKHITIASVHGRLTRRLISRIEKQVNAFHANNQLETTLEDELLHSALDVLDVVDDVPSIGNSKLKRRHQKLLARTLSFVRDSTNGVKGIQQLAAIAGVSDRTLLTMFRRNLGVSPQAFLLSDRLHRSREVLKSSDLEGCTVASIASQFGFLDYGRFAAKYRRLFGELPSETLKS